jgi:hypothetical protein
MGGLSFGQRVAVTSVSVLALAGVVAGGTGTARAAASVSGGAASVSGGAAVSGGVVSVSAGVGCPAGASGAVSVSAGSWAGDVPWHSVGRGWILADLAKSQSASGRGTLYLVSPGGHRYRLGAAPAGATLEDWSGNGTNALFFAQPADSATTGSITVLNLRTGKGSRFTVFSSSPFPGLSFTRPDGKEILFQAGTTADGTTLPLQRLSLAGVRTLCYPTQFARAGGFDGGYQENATGTELVLSMQNGLEVVANDGQPIRALTIGWSDSCGLLNWWSSGSVLVDCSGQLLAYPLSGGRAERLTTARETATFLGAWHLPSGTYAEAAACGSTWLERLNRNGTATVLTIPGAANAGTVQPLGTYGDQLPMLVGGGCDGHVAFSFVDWYNPGANVARTVLGGRAGGGYVTGALLFPAHWRPAGGARGLRRNQCVGQRVDRGQVGGQFGAQVVPCGERGGPEVADLCLPAVRPDQHLEREIQGGQRRGRHHRRARGRVAEHEQHGLAQFQAGLPGLGGLVDHREDLQALRGQDAGQTRDGLGDRPRADLGRAPCTDRVGHHRSPNACAAAGLLAGRHRIPGPGTDYWLRAGRAHPSNGCAGLPGHAGVGRRAAWMFGTTAGRGVRVTPPALAPADS